MFVAFHGVIQGFDSTEGRTAHDDITDSQGSALNHNLGDHASVRSLFAFQANSHGRTLRIGFVVVHFRNRQNRLKQFVHAFASDGARRHHFDVATPSTRSQSKLGHLGHDPIDVRTRQIALVGSHNDRHSCGFRMRNRFFGLRHDTVVGCNNEDSNVGNISSAGSHFRERLVAWRIDKGDRAAIFLDLIGSDLLRDSTRFARHNLGSDQIIEQRSLAVVNVSKERDDWGSSDQIFKTIFDIIHLTNQTGFQRFSLSELKFHA